MRKTQTAGAKARQYESIGRAADGVVILRPAVPPKHFTQSQIEKTVESLRDAPGGQIDTRKPLGTGKSSQHR